MLKISVSPRHILRVLKKESCWLIFDELYSKAQCDCDWTDFALQLERLVDQGEVQYILPYGADIGYYGIGNMGNFSLLIIVG